MEAPSEKSRVTSRKSAPIARASCALMQIYVELQKGPAANIEAIMIMEQQYLQRIGNS